MNETRDDIGLVRRGWRRLWRAHRRWSGDRRGSVAVLFAVSMLLLATVVGAGINMAQSSLVRAQLQGAVDNAALSGAAAYSKNAAAFNALAIRIAVAAFCNVTTALPSGTTVLAQGGAQSCGGTAGPTVTAVADSYVSGTPGITHASGVSCTGTYLPASPYQCGFIVTVSATVTYASVLSSVFGSTITIAATGAAVNPFLSFAQIFSLPNGVVAGAKYANSIWAYPLAMDANGNIDYSSNQGGLPDNSACTGGPDEIACGNYVMLASTMYAASGAGYTPPGQTVIYDQGVVRNPVTPTIITATTPLGIAFRTIAGGNYVQYSPPGVYGYQVQSLGASPVKYVYAPNGCIYPYNNLVYKTVGQVWKTVTTTSGGVTTTSYTPLVPWSLVTHWYYSSYILQNLPPSEGEILAQTANNEVIPSVASDPAQAAGNIAGVPTYNASPSPAVATSCPPTTTTGGVTTSNDTHQTTTFPSSGRTNCSLYIGVSSSSAYIPPDPTYSGSCFDPANTPGQQYAAMSCQQFGNNYYTFYWNDMGGAASDNKNYGDGLVQISCLAQSRVHLIN